MLVILCGHFFYTFVKLYMQKFYSIGKVVTTHGFKGRMVVVSSQEYLSILGMQKVVYFEDKGTFLPYFITNFRFTKAGEAFLEVEEIDSKELAKSKIQQQIYIPENEIDIDDSKFSVLDLVGFTLFDMDKEISKITDIFELPHQILLEVIVNKKKVLVPLHDDFLLKLDKKKKTISLNLPAGILDL